MPHPSFERALKAERPLIGGWVTLAAEPVIEAFFNLPYDYIGIDTQHTLLDVATAARLLHCVPRGGPAALVRVPSNNAADIGKVLDAGGDGVIVPMVNTAAEAAAAVAACRYGPEGIRSFGPMRSGMPYDVAGLTARTACFVMVETREAVNNIDAICATPGVTGIYVGPGDLAVTLGHAVAMHPMPASLESAVVAVGRACARAGVIAAGHFPLAQVGQAARFGFRMVTVGADRGYMAIGAANDIATARAQSAAKAE